MDSVFFLVCCALVGLVFVMIVIVCILYKFIKVQVRHTSRLLGVLERRIIYAPDIKDEPPAAETPSTSQTAVKVVDETTNKTSTPKPSSRGINDCSTPAIMNETSFISVKEEICEESRDVNASAAATELGQSLTSQDTTSTTLNSETPLINLSQAQSDSSETVIYENVTPVSRNTRSKSQSR